MADTQMSRLISERRKRLVASIMGHAEREFYPQLTREQQQAFRSKVLVSIDDFSDLMRDVLKISSGDDVIVNQHALDLITQIHDSQRALTKQLWPA